LHPRFGRFDIASQAVLDVVGCAVELAMPVILCGLSGARGQIASPPPHQVLGSWADAFPEHPFVLAHAGSHRILDAWEMARNRENVYLDLSHTLHYFRGSSIETDIGFVARRLDRRTLFGSDFPECTIGAALEALRGHFRRWPDANQEAILGGTWQTILGISTP
jgi:predicted TIM-barrel fold metal-dependent hydrolase